MKKKKIKLVLLIIIAIGILFIISSENSKTFVKDGITYAVVENGKKADSVPAKGAYKVDVTCTNATGKWDYAKWELEVSNLTQNEVKCNLSFTSTSERFADHIIAHATSGAAQGDGYVVHELVTEKILTNETRLLSSDFQSVTQGASYGFTANSDGTWVSTNKNKNDTSSTVTLVPKTSGNYIICYTIPTFKFYILFV